MGRFDIVYESGYKPVMMKIKASTLLILIFIATTAFHAAPPGNDPYLLWAKKQFGKKEAASAKAIFLKSAGTPVYYFWTSQVNGVFPNNLLKDQSGIKPDQRSWTTVVGKYAFTTAFKNLETRISGVSEKANFKYWQHVFLYFRMRAQTACLIAEMNQFVTQCSQQKDQIGNRIRLASLALDRRNQAAAAWQEMALYRKSCLKTKPEKEKSRARQDDLATLKSLILHDDLIENVLESAVPALKLPQ